MEPTRPTILVVDDNADNRALARGTLEDEGYGVIEAASGQESIALFEAHKPDCVLLDVRMPGMDGFETCKALRASPHGEHTPIVFVTALRDVDTFDTALQVGADDFLTKPVRPAELAVRVQTALKLRRMSTDLKEHVDLVRHQRDALMRLQLQKERLTAFVVHDLKNPVNTMDLHAQLLLREPELPPSARQSAQSIREEARTLLRLVLNLLDISKSEEGQLTARKATVDLAALVAEVEEAHRVKAASTNVRIERSMQATAVVADADLLRRVIENLLDNAIRHAPANSVIHVHAVRRDRETEIRVADEGPGITGDMREKIFERYVQLDAGERIITRTGRGLGLAFCKLAVDAHGGKIWVEDGNPGAVFCMRLYDE